MAQNTNKRIALIQMSCEPSTEANLDKAATRVHEAARAGANIICLPELFRAQYFCQREEHALFDTAESIPGPSTERLSAIVREENVVVIASLFERRAPGLYHNTAAILDPTATAKDNITGIYRKMHIPDDPLYYEKFYFTPGDLGFKAMNTSQGHIGTLVCWDQWYRPPSAEPTPSSTPPPSAGTRPKKPSTAKLSTPLGRPCSAPTPSPTVSSSEPSTA